MRKIIFFTIGIILFMQMIGFCYDRLDFDSNAPTMLVTQLLDSSKVQMPAVSIPIVVNANNAFGFDLYSQFSRMSDGNLFSSPYSIFTALSMLLAGAKGNTEKQIADVLHLSPGEDTHIAILDLKKSLEADLGDGCMLFIANSLWLQEGYKLNKDFVTLARDYYGIEIKEVDYADPQEASRLINGWAGERTKGKIHSIVNPSAINGLTTSNLYSAVYFKGLWEKPFDEYDTRYLPFELITGDKVAVPTMNQTAYFKYAEDVDGKILELPYKDEKFSLIIFLPHQSSKFKDIERTFNSESMSRWASKLQEEYVEVSLPKFTVAPEFSLQETLQSMGLSDMFCGKADFSGITGRKDFSIGSVVHKVFLAVDEGGTVAAGVTGFSLTLIGVQKRPPTPKEFKADHSFFCAIRHNDSGTIFFPGRVIYPRQAGKAIATDSISVSEWMTQLPAKYVELGTQYRGNHDEIYKLGKELRDDGKFTLAIKFYKAYDDERNPQICNGIISALAGGGNIEEAKELLDENYPTTNEKDKGPALYNLGIYLIREGRELEAAQYLRRAADVGITYAQEYIAEVEEMKARLVNKTTIQTYEQAGAVANIFYQIDSPQKYNITGNKRRDDFLANIYTSRSFTEESTQTDVYYKGNLIFQYQSPLTGEGFVCHYPEGYGVYLLGEDIIVKTKDNGDFKITEEESIISVEPIVLF